MWHNPQFPADWMTIYWKKPLIENSFFYALKTAAPTYSLKPLFEGIAYNFNFMLKGTL